jgi:DNA-binding NarL/FixJ family response regulator
MEKIRLLLLEDQTLFRVMLSQLLNTESDFEVAAQCSTSLQALDALGRHQIDLVLLDYDVGNRGTGAEFIRQARNVGYGGRFFVLTAGLNGADYVRALSLGITGIILKDSPPELLTEALRKAVVGETWIDPGCLESLVKAVESEGRQARKYRFTARERAVLNGVFSGLTNRKIGSELKISEGSVKSALQQLFIKTGVRTRSQLVRVVLEEYGTERVLSS